MLLSCSVLVFKEACLVEAAERKRHGPSAAMAIPRMLAKTCRYLETGCHSARLRHALFGYIDMAGRKALGAARREAATARQPPHIRRAAGDCIDIAIARLAVHGRGKQTLSVGMSRRAEHRSDRAAFDDATGIHDRNCVGDLGGYAEIMGHEDHPHAELALQPPQ